MRVFAVIFDLLGPGEEVEEGRFIAQEQRPRSVEVKVL
jgi:hypothetical protein